jgi:hypothetical protein
LTVISDNCARFSKGSDAGNHYVRARNEELSMTRLLIPAAVVAAMFGLPAAAQDASGERVMMVTIPVGGECPEATDPNTIVVCDEIEDPYLIPRQLRQSRDPANRSWTDRVPAAEDVGSLAPGSCNNIGLGSELGCSVLEYEAALAERQNAPGVRFSQQIAEARAERLETIDADAARTQARVEELERAYMARLEAERDAPLPGDDVPPPALQTAE